MSERVRGHLGWGVMVCAGLTQAIAFGGVDPGLRDSVSAWFTPNVAPDTVAPARVREVGPLAKGRVQEMGDMLWEAYAASPAGKALGSVLPEPLALVEGVDPLGQPHALPTGDKIMPFRFVGTGDPQEPRALFLALHGGGSAGGGSPSPHGWAVNTREWETQVRLAAEVYPKDALYFVPRMADDNDGRWYFDYCQDAYDQVIRAAILHHGVDPNRIFLMGISEGAYTAYRLGAFMADRWAGAGSMAGGEPVENAPPENMRNLAFRADIGERDTMFDRVGLNQRYGDALQALRGDDPHGFVHHIQVHPGRGHGIDYGPCPQWLYPRVRDPHPERVRWKIIPVHGRVKKQFYWLAVEAPPGTLPIFLDARVDRAHQTVHLTVECLGPDGLRQPTDRLGTRIYLNDDLLDLDMPVRVVRNGATVFEGIAPRRLDVMLKSLAERGDRHYMFPAEINVPPRAEARAALLRAVNFFRREVAMEGGYLWRYSADLARREGEGEVTTRTVWVQPSGTPGVGLALLNAYELTGEPTCLEGAVEADRVLVRGQLHSGGWTYRVELEPEARKRYAYRVDGPPHRSARNLTTLDDNTTRAALLLMMRADRALAFQDEAIHQGVLHALHAVA